MAYPRMTYYTRMIDNADGHQILGFTSTVRNKKYILDALMDYSAVNQNILLNMIFGIMNQGGMGVLLRLSRRMLVTVG